MREFTAAVADLARAMYEQREGGSKPRVTLEESPGDPVLLGILKDAMLDHGSAAEAEAYCFLLASGKRPYRGGEKWCWFDDDKKPEGLGDPESDLPGAIFSRMEGQVSANHRSYASVMEAHLDLIAGHGKALADGAFDAEKWLKSRSKGSPNKAGNGAK